MHWVISEGVGDGADGGGKDIKITLVKAKKPYRVRRLMRIKLIQRKKLTVSQGDRR